MGEANSENEEAKTEFKCPGCGKLLRVSLAEPTPGRWARYRRWVILVVVALVAVGVVLCLLAVR